MCIEQAAALSTAIAAGIQAGFTIILVFWYIRKQTKIMAKQNSISKMQVDISEKQAEISRLMYQVAGFSCNLQAIHMELTLPEEKLPAFQAKQNELLRLYPDIYRIEDAP